MIVLRVGKHTYSHIFLRGDLAPCFQYLCLNYKIFMFYQQREIQNVPQLKVLPRVLYILALKNIMH
jgi:hypothetical protein